MTRNADETQTFLEWHDDVAYLVTWTPGEACGTIAARVADDDFTQAAAAPWDATIRMEAARAGLDQIAAVNVQMNHDAEKAARMFAATEQDVAA